MPFNFIFIIVVRLVTQTLAWFDLTPGEGPIMIHNIINTTPFITGESFFKSIMYG